MGFYAFHLLFLSYFLLSLSHEKLRALNQKDERELNVIMFFLHIDSPWTFLLNKTMCSLDFQEVKILNDISSQNGENLSYCRELLKENILRLTHYAHAILTMRIAMTSISNKELINDIQEANSNSHLSNSHIDIINSPKIVHRQSQKLNKRKLNYLLTNQYSKKTNSKDKLLNNSNEMKNKSIINGLKHTEVFKIRTKRNVFKNNDNEALRKSRQSLFGILDVANYKRYSLLWKMLPDYFNPSNMENPPIDLSRLRKQKEDAGLFELVKSTLETLLQDDIENSYLMIVFGGHFHSLENQQSSIFQSIKYVIENIDPEDTLVIVTGSCPDTQCSFEKKFRKKTSAVPLFVRGTNIDQFTECNSIYEIPLIVLQILKTKCKTKIENEY